MSETVELDELDEVDELLCSHLDKNQLDFDNTLSIVIFLLASVCFFSLISG
jgi:hypothetical protein